MSRLKFRHPWAATITFIAILTILGATVPAQQVPAWAPNTFYAVGAQVTYQGVTYSCRQAHTSLVSWEPPNVLALWLPLTTGGVGSGGGGGTTDRDTQAPTAPANLR